MMVDSKSRSQSEKFVPLVPAPTYSLPHVLFLWDLSSRRPRDLASDFLPAELNEMQSSGDPRPNGAELLFRTKIGRSTSCPTPVLQSLRVISPLAVGWLLKPYVTVLADNYTAHCWSSMPTKTQDPYITPPSG